MEENENKNENFEEKIKGKGYLEQKNLLHNEIKKIENNKIKEEDINFTLSGACLENVLQTFANHSKIIINHETRLQKMEAKQAVYEQDYEERKDICTDEDVQVLNNAIAYEVQTTMIRFNLLNTQDEEKYRSAIYKILIGRLKKNYLIRHWAKNNTVIKKSIFNILLKSIPEVAREISLKQIKKRSTSYKKNEIERENIKEKEVIDKKIKEGRAFETGTAIVFKKDNYKDNDNDLKNFQLT